MTAETSMQTVRARKAPKWLRDSTFSDSCLCQQSSTDEAQLATVAEDSSQDSIVLKVVAGTACTGLGVDLLALPLDLLAKVFSKLDMKQLIRISGTCKAFALACELCFEDECKSKGWLPPRRPRGDAAVHKSFPWRSLYRRHACAACGSYGDFPVRADFSAALAFLICKKCTASSWVRQRLISENLFIDLVGLSGKRLLNKAGCKVKNARRVRNR